MNFTSKKPHFEYLRKKWTARHRSIQDKFWDKHGKSLRHLALGSLGGLMLLTPGNTLKPAGHELTFSRDDIASDYDKNVLLAQSLGSDVPKEVKPLEPAEERNITEILSKNLGFKVSSEIDGIKLNRNYGLIGGEQHLYRYPGDTLQSHAKTSADWAMYGSAGIAPGLGAWGYFAPSKVDFTALDEQRERYYLAIQTFLVPGYAENVGKYRDFFKFRKMVVINPKTGQVVVAVIGDAGPSPWTGKHLGGSPEVMEAVGLAGGPRKGPVLYFFIDDPNNSVPLGPVKLKAEA